MRIQVRELRRLIREAMASQLSSGMSANVELEGDRALTINILEAGKPKAHSPGVIRLERKQIPGGTVWEVVHSAAKKGYGPMLYDLAMEVIVGYIGDLGITPDTTVVSPEAQNVWTYYLNNRTDVEHDELPLDIFRHAEVRPEALRYYYYKIGTPILDDLIARGLITSNSLSF